MEIQMKKIVTEKSQQYQLISLPVIAFADRLKKNDYYLILVMTVRFK